MVAHRIPSHLIADLLNIDSSEITEQWRDNAEETIYDGIGDFDLDSLLLDVADLQVEYLIEHFKGEVDDDGDSDDDEGDHFRESEVIFQESEMWSFGDYTWYIKHSLLPHFE